MVTNRRRTSRVRLHRDIIVDPLYTAIDISEGGMQIESLRPVRVNRVLSLEIDLDGELWGTQIEVLRCEKPQSIFASGLRIGGRFISPKIALTLRIRRFVEKHQNTSGAV